MFGRMVEVKFCVVMSVGGSALLTGQVTTPGVEAKRAISTGLKCC